MLVPVEVMAQDEQILSEQSHVLEVTTHQQATLRWPVEHLSWKPYYLAGCEASTVHIVRL